MDAIVGASALASAAIALFFLRYWRQTADRFFLLFSLGFFVFALNRVLRGLIDPDGSAPAWIYLTRLLAFVLLAAAILDKNDLVPGRRRGAS